MNRQDWLDIRHHYDDGEPDEPSEELEYVVDAYIKVWATSLDEAMRLIDEAAAKMYGTTGVSVEIFDAYGINDAEGEEIRPVG